jgi:coenzyme Q-binding protein COQ10
VEQVVGLGGLQFRFRSRAELDPPRAIRVHSDDFPFRKLAIGWLFEPTGEGCRVTFCMTYSLVLPGFTRPTGFLLRGAAAETMRAFHHRAWQVYGDPAA